MKVFLLDRENIAPPTSVPYGFFPKSFFEENNLTNHSILRIEYKKRRVNFIAVELEQLEYISNNFEISNEVNPNHFLIPTFRLKKLLNIKGSCIVELLPEKCFDLEVKPTLIDDFPGINEIDVNREIYNHFKRTGLQPYLIYNKIIFPVSLRTGNYINSSQVRISMSTRVLLNPDEGENKIAKLSLSGFRKAERIFLFPRKNYYSYQSIEKEILNFFKRLFNLPAVILEYAIGFLISTPPMFLRTTEPFDGDDHQPMVRMHDDCFNLLGISPGDQIIIQWVNRHTVAIALKFEGIDQIRDKILNKNKRRVETFWKNTHIPVDHLTVCMSATLRAALGIPRYTIVCIRRRALTVFLKKFNELLLPLVGLVIAGSTIPGFRPIYYLYGAIISILFVLISIRKWSTPKGIWP